MSYKIILDSCGELPPKYKADERFEIVSLGIEVEIIRSWMTRILTRRNFSQRWRHARNARNLPALPRRAIWKHAIAMRIMCIS